MKANGKKIIPLWMMDHQMQKPPKKKIASTFEGKPWCMSNQFSALYKYMIHDHKKS